MADMNTIEQNITEFLDETAPLLEQVDDLPFETAAELYDMYEIAAKTATDHIAGINPELRVTLCDRLDNILDRIAGFELQFSVTHKNIYTPAVQGYRTWANVELMKDCGLAGYLLGKQLGLKPIMLFGDSSQEYPYLDILPGMELIYPDGELKEAYYKHLTDNCAEMDVLILHGMYVQTLEYLHEYRKLRPGGKVYCGLDMNTYWMGQIDFNCEVSKLFAVQCDIIATSCRSVRDELNRNPNVTFPCRWLTNGFFNPTGIEVTADASEKENIILTVGRIGLETKNNLELLFTYAKNSDELKGWKLRFAGPVNEDFKPTIEKFCRERPDLKDRVTFTGAITDKAELYKEYARAKIFVMTSLSEGGTPNVYAEALFHGCMFVTSDIDAADDMINFGELGMKYKTGDTDALGAALIRMCKKADKGALEKHIPKALAYANRYYDWNRNAVKLAYMLFK